MDWLALDEPELLDRLALDELELFDWFVLDEPELLDVPAFDLSVDGAVVGFAVLVLVSAVVLFSSAFSVVVSDTFGFALVFVSAFSETSLSSSALTFTSTSVGFFALFVLELALVIGLTDSSAMLFVGANAPDAVATISAVATTVTVMIPAV